MHECEKIGFAKFEKNIVYKSPKDIPSQGGLLFKISKIIMNFLSIFSTKFQKKDDQKILIFYLIF